MPTVYPTCPINAPGEPPLNESPQPPLLRETPGKNGGVWRYAYRGLLVGGGRGKPPCLTTESVTSLRRRRPLCAVSPSGASHLRETDCTCDKGLARSRACSFLPNGPAGYDPARRCSAAGRACSPGERRSAGTARGRRRELRSALVGASACTARYLCARSPRRPPPRYAETPAPSGPRRAGVTACARMPYKAETPSLTRGATLAKYTVTPARASDARYERVKCWRARASMSPTLYRRMPPSLDAGATLPLCCHFLTVESLTCTPARSSATRVARVRGS